MVKAAGADVAPISDWLPAASAAVVDVSHAVLVEVDYPALAGNNAGWALHIVTPGANGPVLYDVR